MHNNNYRYLVIIMVYLGLMTGCTSLLQSNNSQSAMQSKQENNNTLKVQYLFKIARDHQQKNELIEALNIYEKIIELVPSHPDSYNNMGMIYFMMGEDELGLQFFSEAIRLAPTVSSLHNNLGYALLKQGRYREAVEVLERAVLLDPSNSHARNNLSDALRKMNCQDDVLCGKWQDPQ